MGVKLLIAYHVHPLTCIIRLVINIAQINSILIAQIGIVRVVRVLVLLVLDLLSVLDAQLILIFTMSLSYVLANVPPIIMAMQVLENAQLVLPDVLNALELALLNVKVVTRDCSTLISHANQHALLEHILILQTMFAPIAILIVPHAQMLQKNA